MKVKIQLPSCHSDKIAGRPKLGADRESCQESNLSCSFSPFLPPISPIDPLIYHLPNLPQTLPFALSFPLFFLHSLRPLELLLHPLRPLLRAFTFGKPQLKQPKPVQWLSSWVDLPFYIKTSQLDIGTDLKIFRYIFETFSSTSKEPFTNSDTRWRKWQICFQELSSTYLSDFDVFTSLSDICLTFIWHVSDFDVMTLLSDMCLTLMWWHRFLTCVSFWCDDIVIWHLSDFDAMTSLSQQCRLLVIGLILSPLLRCKWIKWNNLAAVDVETLYCCSSLQQINQTG